MHAGMCVVCGGHLLPSPPFLYVLDTVAIATQVSCSSCIYQRHQSRSVRGGEGRWRGEEGRGRGERRRGTEEGRGGRREEGKGGEGEVMGGMVVP